MSDDLRRAAVSFSSETHAEEPPKGVLVERAGSEIRQFVRLGLVTGAEASPTITEHLDLYYRTDGSPLDPRAVTNRATAQR